MQTLQLMCAAICFAIISIALGFTTGIDDAHITYFSAHTLATSHEILNYNLERVEQSSSLLHVVLTALLASISSLDTVTAGHLIPLLFAALCIAAVFFSAKKNNTNPLVASLFCATSTSLIYWSQAGLESTISAFFLLAHLITLSRHIQEKSQSIILIITGLLLQATRPEMVLFVPLLTVTISAFYYFCYPKIRFNMGCISASILAFAIAGSIALWRQYYFGDWMPQPVAAKSSGITLKTLQQGFIYLLSSHGSIIGILKATLAALACVITLYHSLKNKKGDLYTNLALTCVGYTAVIVAIGGDWMPEGRLWVTLIPLVSLLSAQLLASITRSKWHLSLATAAIVAVNFSHLYILGSKNRAQLAQEPMPALENIVFFEKYSVDNRSNINTLLFLQKTLNQAIIGQDQKPINLLSGQMGFIAYHLAKAHPGSLHFTDRNGLIERSLTLCPLTKNRPRVSQGIEGLATVFFLKKHKELNQHCKIPTPDLIFDLWLDVTTENATTTLSQLGFHRIFLDPMPNTLTDQMILASTDFLNTLERK